MTELSNVIDGFMNTEIWYNRVRGSENEKGK